MAACIVTDLSLAASGYKDAADLLVDSLHEKGRNDALVFPIVFCYRHYVGLRLKALAESARWFTGEEFKHTHNLVTLWTPVKQRLNAQL